ncbi:uncharacterized protein LOC118486633 [Helianthus annuus]|uniref:uncharacterized protein LOC118486632 n=1 Tax=Helianthus annuus TaxID=4232 RepID=UPI001652DDEA|nr:uncharacterized protein LOC118486632 [Helianthus annuus]XP_035839104.1 uncharacterized protein LOC118486633 [Helianthus annuus]
MTMSGSGQRRRSIVSVQDRFSYARLFEWYAVLSLFRVLFRVRITDSGSVLVREFRSSQSSVQSFGFSVRFNIRFEVLFGCFESFGSTWIRVLFPGYFGSVNGSGQPLSTVNTGSKLVNAVRRNDMKIRNALVAR